MKIQILLATHNGQGYLGTQLDSLIAQIRKPSDKYSILASDDGSSDGTREILFEYEERYPGIIELLTPESFGSAAGNFMRLARESDGDIVFFCDQDDWWAPEKVSRISAAFSEEDVPQLAYSDAYIADESLNILRTDERRLQTYARELSLQRLLVQNYIPGCTMAVNRTLLAGALRDEYPGMQMHDWWLAIYAAAFGRIVHVPEKLIKYRQHGDNAVGAKDVRSLSYIGSHLDGKRLRESCGKLLIQAKGFYGCYGREMAPEARRIVRDFYTLREKDKLSRIALQLRGGYLKSTAARVLGQLIYM